MRDILLYRGLAERRPLAFLLAWMAACAERRRQRLTLVSLSDAGLRDIGLSRMDVEQEFAKPSWRR